MNLKGYEFFLMRGSESPLGYTHHYESLYATWRKVWLEAFQELDGINQLASDGFTRQSRWGAIFRDSRCVSMIALRDCDFRDSVHRDDSLLASWTPTAFQRLLKDGPRVSICSYLSVHPDFRRNDELGFSLKQLISHLAVRMLLDSDADVMTGTTRCNRGTDKAAYGTGATFLEKAEMHGVEVDLIAIYRRYVSTTWSQWANPVAEELWRQRLDLTQSIKTPEIPTQPLQEAI